MRLTYLDSLKGLGIIIVILYHCFYIPANSMLIQGIYSIGVPIFFMVNGYLMLRKEYSLETILKRNLKLLILIAIWSVMSTAVCMFKFGDWQSHNLLDGMHLLGYYVIHSIVPYCQYLWFLKALFFLNLINPILYHFIHYKQNGIYYLLTILFVCTTAFSNKLVGIFYNPIGKHYWYSVLYYVLGFALFSNQIKTSQIKTKYLVCIIATLILCQWAYNWILLDGPLADKHFINDLVFEGYNAPFIVFLTAAICLFFQRIPWKENGFLSRIGKISLPIYLMQIPIQYTWLFLLPLDALTEQHHIYGIILPTLTLLTSIVLTWLFKKSKPTEYIVSV